MENEKMKKEKMPLWLTIICVLGLCIIGYKGYEEIKLNNKKSEWASQTPTVDAITQQDFEDLPVGLIYEISEEDQKAYLEAAKLKYETYKHLGPQQSDSLVWDPEYYTETREDVIVRSNSQPSDMLNEDMSLRYPDMFYGFIIHDESITGDLSEEIAASCEIENMNYCSDKAMADKMNQIFYVEEQFSNGMTILEHYGGTLEKAYTKEVNSETDYPEAEMFRRAIKSNFYESDADQGVVNTIFDYMFASTGSQGDAYNAAYNSMENNYSSYYYNNVEKIDLFPEKYNDVENWDDTYAVYFYPTAIWKIDDNTIVVDIAVVNGDRMALDDMCEILAKLNQANTNANNNSSTELYPINEIKNDTYLVMGRFFDAENITNGIMPEYGTYVLNYKSIGNWVNGLSVVIDRATYIFNDEAKSFLSEFYDILSEKLENNDTLSTEKMIQKAAKLTGVSYQDALNIYATHYLLSTTNSAQNGWSWQ